MRQIRKLFLVTVQQHPNSRALQTMQVFAVDKRQVELQMKSLGYKESQIISIELAMGENDNE